MKELEKNNESLAVSLKASNELVVTKETALAERETIHTKLQQQFDATSEENERIGAQVKNISTQRSVISFIAILAVIGAAVFWRRGQPTA